MRKLDQRGVAALEFCLLALSLLTLLFTKFDLACNPDAVLAMAWAMMIQC